MKLNIIRHGRTEANEKQLHCGQTDVPLSRKGMHELALLKKTIAYPTAAVYISSGLKRATETLRILYNREPDVIISEFKEIHHGDFEMKSHDDLKDNPEYQRWISDAYNLPYPNGESGAEFNDRVKIGLDKLVAMKIDSATVICHGGVIVSILERMFPNQKNYYEWQPDNGRGYILEIITTEKAILSSEI